MTLTVSQGPEPVVVPDVVGMAQSEASQTLTGAGFVVNAVPEENDDVPEDVVISQDPPGNAEVAPNATITIKVSSGSGTIPIPDVAGQSEATARANLNSAGFTSITVANEASGDVPAGNVIRVDPAPGTEVPANQAITLVISSGREQATVPPVEGLNEQNARSQIEAAGLVVSVSEQDVSNPGQDGRVLSQSPVANQQVNRGDTVNIVVGRLAVPDPGGD